MAPVFADVVGDLTDLLAGRVVVAHNSAFDASFLVAGSLVSTAHAQAGRLASRAT